MLDSRSMQAPAGPVVEITDALVSDAAARSRQSPRGRIILRFHETDSDTLQRMLNALQPGSYVHPHRHLTPLKAESIIVLRGSVGCVIFHDDGRIMKHFVLSARSGRLGVDIRPGVYHTLFALEEDTVVFEVKPGPYDETREKAWAPWAPAEGSEQSKEFLSELTRLVLSTPSEARW